MTWSTSDAVVSSRLIPASDNPAARSAPRAFGPRTRMRVLARPSSNGWSETGGVRRFEPAADAERGGRQQHVRPGRDDGGGGVDQPGILVGRDDPQGRRVQHLGAPPLQRGDQIADRRSEVTPMRKPTSWSGSNPVTASALSGSVTAVTPRCSVAPRSSCPGSHDKSLPASGPATARRQMLKPERAHLLAAVLGDLLRSPRRQPDPVDPEVVHQAGLARPAPRTPAPRSSR